MLIELRLFIAAVLLILCVFASKATGKLGVPTLVIFLAVGILAGSEGIGGIEFNDANAAQSLGIVALAYILFSGGLDTKWPAIRPILNLGIALSTIGVILTCLLVGSFVHLALGFGLHESFLIGAIISSTDAGAVFTILSSKSIHLKKHLKPLLELESGSNDPMAVFLTTTILQMISNPSMGVIDMVPMLFQQMIIGALMGYVIGRALVWIFNISKLEIEGLYLVMSIGVVLLTYSATQLLKGNGFLAVYVAGVVLGNHKFLFKKSLAVMHDGVSWLMQSVMFLTLGLLMYPSQLLQISKTGLLISAFMILVARPVAVFATLAFSRLNFREKGLVSWVGLRGSVPVIMATYPLVAGIDRAGLIFNIVFFVCLSSLIVQGTTIPIVSRLLKVDGEKKDIPRYFASTPGSLSEIVVVDVPPDSVMIGKNIVELDLPSHRVLIVAIERNREVIIPRGNTSLDEGDKISIMADDNDLADFVERLWERRHLDPSRLPRSFEDLRPH